MCSFRFSSGFTNPSSGNSWLNKSSFNFGSIFNANTVPSGESTPKKAEEEDDSDAEEKDTVEPNENDPHFEPIIPLPNLVETKTGEEDECIGTSFTVDKSKVFSCIRC